MSEFQDTDQLLIDLDYYDDVDKAIHDEEVEAELSEIEALIEEATNLEADASESEPVAAAGQEDTVPQAAPARARATTLEDED